MREILLRAEKLVKVYPSNGIKAVDNVDLTLHSGETHAVVGENGVGKSSLMHIFSGYIVPDSGIVKKQSRPVAFGNPHRTLKEGIGMVYQNLRLIENASVWKNIILGAEYKKWGIFLDTNKCFSAVENLLVRHNIPLDPGIPVRKITSGKKVLTSLAAVLMHNPEVVILDEPTASATEEEAEIIFDTIKHLNENGMGIILISHKLRDIFRTAHTVSVIKEGKLLKSIPVANTTMDELSYLMMGESPSKPVKRMKKPIGETVFRLEHCFLRENVLKDISFAAKKGEILGITGIREHGLVSLERILSGEERISSGTIIINNKQINNFTPKEFRRNGIAYVPTERLLKGASLDSSVGENLIILRRKQLQRAGFLKRKEIDAFTARLRTNYSIKGRDKDKLRHLSGGNIQKVILSRELSFSGNLVIFSEPGWGLDIQSRATIFEEIRSIAQKGTAVIIITPDLDEIMELADRTLVLYEGEIIKEFILRDVEENIRHSMALAMMGKRTDNQ